jgi:hypothetical protein
MELEGFGSRKRTIHFANTCVSQYCVFGLSVCWEFSVVADQKCFQSTVDLREVSRGLYWLCIFWSF